MICGSLKCLWFRVSLGPLPTLETSDIIEERAFLPVPQEFDVWARVYISSLVFQQKLTPQSIKFLNQMLFFFFLW